MIIYILFIFSNCSTENYFKIKLFDKQIYNDINLLMQEIYQNAKNDNIDYFIPHAKRELLEAAKYWHGESYLEFFNDNHIITHANKLMWLFVESKIHKTYKKRAFIIPNGISFDYSDYCHRRGICYVMILKFDQDNKIMIHGIYIGR